MRAALALCLIWAGAASAQAPDGSFRPELRPPSGFLAIAEPMLPHAPRFAIGALSAEVPRPVARPGVLVEVSAAAVRPLVRPGAVLEGASEGEDGAALRPVPRPARVAPPVEPEPPVVAEGPRGSYELTLRGGLFGGGTRVVEVPAFADDRDGMVLLSPMPQLRPDGLEARVRAAATRATPGRVTELGVRGQLCGSAGIFGDRLEPITGRISGCGIAEPVRVREVNGIALTTPATINCNAALALQDWLGEAQEIVGATGGGLVQIRVVASYSCRTRNNQPGARLSEHSTGNGIDIAGFGLANGQEISLLSGWRDGAEGPILRRLHAAACGPFGTVLGPESDRFHQDHFHFDVADYRSGAYCR